MKDDKEKPLPDCKITKTPGEFQATQGVNNESANTARQQMFGGCYDSLIKVMKEYLDYPEDYYKFIAIWIIATYLRSNFRTFPLLYFNAMRGSAKTRTLSFISALSKGGNGKVVNNITEAVLFRHQKDVILCIDECEGISNKDKSALREILNSTYKKGMVVKRVKKMRLGGVEQQVVETFEPDFPVALANINGLEEVLADRAITLILEKSNNPYFTKRLEDFDINQIIQNIKRTLEQISVGYVVSMSPENYITAWNRYISEKYSHSHINTIILPTYIDIPNTEGVITKIELYDFFNKVDCSEINGRNFELLFPMLLTARSLSEDTFLDILDVCKRLISGKTEEEYADSKDVSLYEFVANHGTNEFVRLKDFTAHFKLFIGESANSQDNWCNEQWVAYALKRLKLVKIKKREASGRLILLDIEKAKEKLKIFK